MMLVHKGDEVLGKERNALALLILTCSRAERLA
jgi:hypothetical protein